MLSHLPTTDKFILRSHDRELVSAHSFLPLGCALKPRHRAHADDTSRVSISCYKRSDDPKGLIRMLGGSPRLNSFQKGKPFRSRGECSHNEVLPYLNLVGLRVQNSEADLFTLGYGGRYRHELSSQRLECELVWSRVHENTTVNSCTAAFKCHHRARSSFLIKWDGVIARALRSNHCYIICLKICIFTNSMIP